MANKKIKMNEKNADGTFNVLHPETTTEQVINPLTGQSINEHFTDTIKKHIEIVEEIPANLEGKSIFFKKQGDVTDAPNKPTIQDLDDRLAQTNKKVNGLVSAHEFGVVPNNTVGNSANLQALIDSVRQAFIESNLTIQPIVHLESGIYILDAEVKMSPYLKFKTLGTVIFKITHNGTGIHITPSANDPAYDDSSQYYLFKNFWNRGKYFEGTFVFTSELDYTSDSVNTIALEIGARNDTFGEGRAISRYTVEQINVFGISTAIKLNTFHHYIGTFENCHIEHMKHAFVWGNELVETVNSGEKFMIKDCVLAGSSKDVIKLNAPGIDLTVQNTSFDFNTSPLFSMKESGVGLRLSDCYIEEIDGDQQLLVSCKPNSTGSTGGRNTIVINGVQALLRRYGKFIENLEHPINNERIGLAISVSGLEVRHIDTSTAIPISKAFLIDTSENITLTNKDMFINPSLQSVLLTDSVDVAANGDFSKSIVGEDLDNEEEKYWLIDATDGLSNIVANNGVGGSNSVDVTITNTTDYRYIGLFAKHSIHAVAGQSIVIMPSVKGANIDSSFCAECFVYCYDASDALIDTLNYYAFFTENTVTLNEYCYPRYIPKLDLPKGTVSVTYGVALVTPPNSTTLRYSINNIFVAIVGD